MVNLERRRRIGQNLLFVTTDLMRAELGAKVVLEALVAAIARIYITPMSDRSGGIDIEAACRHISTLLTERLARQTARGHGVGTVTPLPVLSGKGG